MKHLLPLFAFLLITGCAHNPAPVAADNLVPDGDTFAGYHEYAQPKEGAVQVTVERDKGLVVGGTWMPVELSINGVSIAKLHRSQRLELYLKPGDYIVALQGYPLLQNLITRTDVSIESGKRYAFDIIYNEGDFLFKQANPGQ